MGEGPEQAMYLGAQTTLGVPRPRGGDFPEIRIVEVLNGLILSVGCQTVVFETKEKMAAELLRYLGNRDEVAKEYYDRKHKKEA